MRGFVDYVEGGEKENRDEEEKEHCKEARAASFSVETEREPQEEGKSWGIMLCTMKLPDH